VAHYRFEPGNNLPWDVRSFLKFHLKFLKKFCIGNSTSLLLPLRVPALGPPLSNLCCRFVAQVGQVWTNPPKFNSLAHSDFHYFGLFANKKQAVTKHLTLTVSVSGYNTLCQTWEMFKYQLWLHGLVCTICYNVPCVHQIHNTVLAIKVFVT